ncbi:TIGR04282 family arsenosugar biosynthesis glycosyltransferase [Fenollaria massiliensis]|uniref:Glycosyltransferase n=1 Tax=Fenollaria massiliensis TaxID=938288 RepID=A0A9E7DJB7_9FIRM|nr:TIGR04282 family arsenosugar biosynthesis glycosyltransferase [Fenollaria massiliensis]UQK58862.1 glycosyltransferase [Fenollaria massiliensis]
MKNLLIIFTRVPIEGHTKTRLEDFLSKKDIVLFHKNLIKRLISDVKSQEWDLEVHVTPFEKVNILKEFLPNERYKAQADANLFEKMEIAIDTALKTYDKVAIIGSDIYDISAKDIKNAFDALDDNDIVFNPSSDGGYSLVASKINLKGKLNIDFINKSMILDETIKNSNSSRIKCLRIIDDIDTKEDLLYNYFGKNVEFLSEDEIILDGKKIRLDEKIFHDLININNWRNNNEEKNNI